VRNPARPEPDRRVMPDSVTALSARTPAREAAPGRPGSLELNGLKSLGFRSVLRAGACGPRDGSPVSRAALGKSEKKASGALAGGSEAEVADVGSNFEAPRRAARGPALGVGRDLGFDLEGVLDPLARALAAQQFRVSQQYVAPPTSSPRSLDLEQLFSQLVRRVAWGGDRRKGTARIEFGSGELSGATLLVEADQNELKVDLELPPGVPAEPWRERLAARLQERGFNVRELSVR
jgi:hypothetical protein